MSETTIYPVAYWVSLVALDEIRADFADDQHDAQVSLPADAWVKLGRPGRIVCNVKPGATS